MSQKRWIVNSEREAGEVKAFLARCIASNAPVEVIIRRYQPPQTRDQRNAFEGLIRRAATFFHYQSADLKNFREAVIVDIDPAGVEVFDLPCGRRKEIRLTSAKWSKEKMSDMITKAEALFSEWGYVDVPPA